ncbi:secretion protein [Bordetella ansorpii]|uniref:Secretion protein n=1 Tax=Bordetella ansorpii TaxID=288768 RepID=A0A157KK58_9BORD|nr:HlyD family secretion protein [Bordetella ansorpii]SAH84506.1 secretion protein [Bordetella ansorpii]
MALPKSIKIAGACVLAACIAGSFYVLNRPASSASAQATDDAYVMADMTLVAPQVAGQVVEVAVRDNQAVQAGDLLARIDDRDFVLAVQSARARVSETAAAVQGLQAEIAMQASAIRQRRAELAASEAELTLARADAARYRNLAKDGAGTAQAYQQADAALRIRQAARDRNDAALQAETRKTDTLQAALLKAQATGQTAAAALELAQLQLTRTRIVAPVAGTVGERAVRVGSFVSIGKPIVTLVPLQDIYIEANFRETQLARVHAGQPVSIVVDALPGLAFSGSVESLGPASGVSYAPIAPHNATGNFTKIVQRLPVRIALDPGQPGLDQLRVGMSVQPEIDVEAGSGRS